jgi:hypothetical protein
MTKEQRISDFYLIVKAALRVHDNDSINFSRFAKLLHQHSGKLTTRQHVFFWSKNGFPVSSRNKRRQDAIDLALSVNPDFKLTAL